MAEKDYYNILGIDRNASKEDIKKAWKRLAKKYHPDMNKSHDAAEKFKEISEAASVLGDEKKKAHYDQFGTAEPGFGAGGPGGADFSGFSSGDFGGFGDLDDIFESFFGGGFSRGRKRQSAKMHGSDLRFDMEITLEEAAFGVTKKIIIPKLVQCEKCNGSGAKSSADIAICDVCGGEGAEKRVRKTPFGLFQTTTTCHKCNGQGKMIRNSCRECDGTGVVNKNHKLDIKIPAGVDTGSRLRVSGEGEAGERGGASGDLYVVIHVAQHKIFERHGDDIYLEIPITFFQACMGDEVEVPTLKGKATLKIPPGTQTGTVFRMRGKGIESLHSYGTGNQNIKVDVEVPTKLSKRQKELLKEFDKESGKSKTIFEKLFGK